MSEFVQVRNVVPDADKASNGKSDDEDTVLTLRP